jgi:hypothetical protein
MKNKKYKMPYKSVKPGEQIIEISSEIKDIFLKLIEDVILQKTLREIAELKAELVKYESRQTAEWRNSVSGQPINITANQKGGD